VRFEIKVSVSGVTSLTRSGEGGGEAGWSGAMVLGERLRYLIVSGEKRRR
jgi:hypothetical protein